MNVFKERIISTISLHTVLVDYVHCRYRHLSDVGIPYTRVCVCMRAYVSVILIYNVCIYNTFSIIHIALLYVNRGFLKFLIF